MKFCLQIDEKGVYDIVSLGHECKHNSFDPENQNPQTLQTGAYALEELVNNFKSAYEDGEALVQDSINTRLISKSKSLFDPYLKKNGRHSQTSNCLTSVRNIHKTRWKLQL